MYNKLERWTYWYEDEEIKINVQYFLDRNEFFDNKFKECNIKIYDAYFVR